MSPASRADCEALDAADALGRLRRQFRIPEGLIYLDGNSLGPVPESVSGALAQAVERDWGRGLVRSWNNADWIELPQRIGAAIARLIGAEADEVIVADSTSVNLFKVLSAALRMRPDRAVILSEPGNFPTDLYIAQGLIEQLGGRHTLRLVERDALGQAIGPDVAAVMLTQVDYRSGHRLDLEAISARARAAGAITIWDLAHSAGAFEVDLNAAGADFAVGCGYKYLNGGPGAPAFLFVARRHQQAFTQPLSGWMGHARPFAFETGYQPASGIGRYLCGTPPVLSMIALERGVDTVLAALGHGGMAALRAKSVALCELFIEQVERRCAAFGLTLASPRDASSRGSQVSFASADGDSGYAIIQALIARGVIGDFRAPDILRFGFAPLYVRHVDAWDAAEALAEIMRTEAWNRPEFLTRQAVT
ncbi:MAG: kynureninase [Burkholderiales bacterium]|nr:MAG: kynureninase [Burkholderiales bacterium]